MGSTPNFGFPYPDGNDYIDASAISGLATAVDETLDDIEGTQHPTAITLTPINGWSTVGASQGADPVRLYRMGRLVQMMGEAIYNPSGSNVGDPVPSNREQIFNLPVGWRPSKRLRVVAARSSGVTAELLIGSDGVVSMSQALVRHATPGYSLHASWVTAD